jgi:hypothetical protein
MNKVKLSGLIIGIIGFAILSFCLILTMVNIVFYENLYAGWEVNLFSICAILWSISFIFGVGAIVSYMQKRGAYFMILSTIIGALGWIPLILRSQNPEVQSHYGTSLVIIPFIMTFTMLLSSILLAIS